MGEAGIAEALCVPPVQGFGTVCASLVALGAAGARRWRFCAGPPGAAPFAGLTLGKGVAGMRGGAPLPLL